jgi:hypothetical protein
VTLQTYGGKGFVKFANAEAAALALRILDGTRVGESELSLAYARRINSPPTSAVVHAVVPATDGL